MLRLFVFRLLVNARSSTVIFLVIRNDHCSRVIVLYFGSSGNSFHKNFGNILGDILSLSCNAQTHTLVFRA